MLAWVWCDLRFFIIIIVYVLLFEAMPGLRCFPRVTTHKQ